MRHFDKYLNFIKGVSREPLGRYGVALTSSAFFMFLFMEIARMTGLITNAYVGLVSYLVLPLLFIVGLIMIPLGWKRRQRKTGKSPSELMEQQFERTALEKGFFGSSFFQTVALLTMVNVLFMIIAGSQTLSFMDEPEFCGTACHSVMNPEWQTYQVSSHANVSCVSCHVGEGAEALLESKLNGLWQMASVTFDLYERPIPTPVHQLRPARETCEKCHWPAKQYGEELVKKVTYSNDEWTRPSYTTLGIKIDADTRTDRKGVHWHIAEGVEMTYTSIDPKRQKISEVTVKYPDGHERTFINKKLVDHDTSSEERVMDCVDCHNRATHVYKDPEHIVDAFLAEGKLPVDLPYIRREALSALRNGSPDKDLGREMVSTHLFKFYQKQYPEIRHTRQKELSQVGELLAAEYDRYIHPNMQITWNSYPSNLGHDANSGCFRCHHKDMVNDDLVSVSSDCTVCHDIFAYDSPSQYAFMGTPEEKAPEQAIHAYLKQQLDAGTQ